MLINKQQTEERSPYMVCSLHAHRAKNTQENLSDRAA
jgi:hypothetical protein